MLFFRFSVASLTADRNKEWFGMHLVSAKIGVVTAKSDGA
jgi:hypothetical protein